MKHEICKRLIVVTVKAERTTEYVEIVAFQFFNAHFDEQSYGLHATELGLGHILTQHFSKSRGVLEKYLNAIRKVCK